MLREQLPPLDGLLLRHLHLHLRPRRLHRDLLKLLKLLQLVELLELHGGGHLQAGWQRQLWHWYLRHR